MNTLLKRITWLVFIAPAIYLLIIWKKIPAIIPMHYNLQGEPDRFGNKRELWLMLVIITAVNIGVYFLLRNLHRIDPRKNAVENKEKMQRLTFGVNLFLACLSVVVIYYSTHPSLPFRFHFILVGMGLLFALIGNYMYTIKPNYFAGLRLPWTLENEENWRKTHLLGGKLWFAGGLLIAIISLFVSQQTALFISGMVLLIMIIVPTIYSYRLYKRQNRVKSIN